MVFDYGPAMLSLLLLRMLERQAWRMRFITGRGMEIAYVSLASDFGREDLVEVVQGNYR